MQTIGERLQQTRNRRGISLKEAAEATKIRPDYLAFFEENYFEIPLPEIYRRGFLVLYLQYLKMDLEGIMAEYDARYKRKGSARERREVYARMHVTEKFKEETTEEIAQGMPAGPSGAPSLGSVEATPRESGPAETIFAKPRKQLNAWTLRLKRPVWVFGALGAAVLGAIGLAFWPSSRPASPKSSASYAAGSPTQQLAQVGGALLAPEAAVLPAPALEPQEELLFEARGGEVTLSVLQENDQTYPLNRITLKAGETVSIRKQGPIKIHFSEGQYLKVKKGNQTYGMNATGQGTRRLP